MTLNTASLPIIRETLLPPLIQNANHCEICWIDETKEEPHRWQVADTNPIADINQRRQQQWLRGRMATKQAVKQLLARCHGITVDPTSIQLNIDELGRPIVAIKDTPEINTAIAPPAISIAHANHISIAIAVDSSEQLHVGIDLERLRPLEAGEATKEAIEKAVLADIILCPEENRFLSIRNNESMDERLLRLWCAKEAASKAIGVGLQGNPHHYLVHEYDASTGTAVVICNTSRIRHTCCIHHIPDTPILVVTTRHGDWIIAIAAVPASVLVPGPSLSPLHLRD